MMGIVRLSTGALICLAVLGCAHTQRKERVTEQDRALGFEALERGHLVAMRKGRVLDADIAVQKKEDGGGKYSLINCTPGPNTPRWFATQVEIPQMEFPKGAEWVELELWNDGSPVNVVADASDQRAKCFELTFCHNETKWTGWKKFRVALRGNVSASRNIDLDREIEPPLCIKYILIIMRQGLPWQIGLRKMTIRLDPQS